MQQSRRRRQSSLPLIVVLGVVAIGLALVTIPKLTSPGSTSGIAPLASATSTAELAAPADPAAIVATEHGVVTHLVDGDTLDVTLNGVRTRIRLLNVDAPETVKPDTPVQCMGPEASARLKQLAPLGSTVGLAFDVGRLDQYGRTLAMVITPDGQNASYVLAREGLARAVEFSPNFAGYAGAVAAVKSAQDARLGLWSGVCG